MNIFKILGTLIIVVLIGLGTFTIIKGAINYLNPNSPFTNVILIGFSLLGLIVIAYKGIQVIWKV
jgi:hypothetical protein